MQARVAGLNVGLIAIKPEGAGDPEAVIGVYNPATGSPEQHLVRPGARFEVAGRSVEIGRIVPAGRGLIEVTVTWDDRP